MEVEVVELLDVLNAAKSETACVADDVVAIFHKMEMDLPLVVDTINIEGESSNNTRARTSAFVDGEMR